MKNRYLIIICFCLFLASVCYALNARDFSANHISFPEDSVILNAHEKILLGVSCKSGPVGKLPNLKELKIGDKIELGKYSFNVGIIECTEYYEDAVWGKQVIAKKGDVVCVAAAKKDMLPRDNECHAVWLRITNCKLVD